MNARRLALPILLLPLACFASPPRGDVVADDSPRALPWAAPAIERAVSVRDGRTGESISFDDLLDELEDAHAVFLGETHTDETTHRVELAVYEGLLERRSGRVVLAMEMFERDVQPALDAYVAGNSTEAEFLAAARPWKNYPTAYRPMIELARERRAPVVASNFPTPLRRKMAQEGEAVLKALEGPAQAQAPREYFANTPEYWRRVDNATRGHAANMPANPADADAERLYSTQSLWDNSMGESCALALDAHPKHSVLHVNGGFHTEYWDGTARQFSLRKPDAAVRTVAIVPTSNPAVADVGGKPVADFVVFAETRATDVNEGSYSVSVGRAIEYRMHLPKGDELAPLPLLVWFADDGEAAADSLALLRKWFGDETAIAVVEAPYRETQEDLVEGARWFWPDTFSADVGALVNAAEEIWAYSLRHHPIDPGRIAFGGEGTGATVAAAVALLSDRASAHTVALAPRKFAKLKDIPLPLPELRGDARAPAKSLHVVVESADEAWWSGELGEYRAIGLESTLTVAGDDPWLRESERESALRTALGLEPSALPSEGPARHIVADTPRARTWARLVAADRRAKDGTLVAVFDEAPAGQTDSEMIETDVEPSELASGEKLPRCPGPFGGTTVLVVHASASPEELAAWVAIEENDPLAKKSPFMRVRIASESDERSLSNVLTKLAGQGRKNVLIVPATFCADGETMRGLRRSVREFDDQMTLHWRPGLGGAAE